ncbi:hypothetical protein AU374_03223 [Cupriavidus metallidurans]|nr:hypothetical protein AU374_03223 [Cupriavidus metallidurans]
MSDAINRDLRLLAAIAYGEVSLPPQNESLAEVKLKQGEM